MTSTITGWVGAPHSVCTKRLLTLFIYFLCAGASIASSYSAY